MTVVVGILGGVASGKSQVTQILKGLGAEVVSADLIAHEVLREPKVVEKLVDEFGPQILSGQKESELPLPTVDRKSLAALVFGESDENTVRRKRLEAIVHPRIRNIGHARLERIKSSGSARLVVLDVPLLVEGGWLPWCDRVIFVDSPETMRKTFALERGWSEIEWRHREAAQLKLQEKRSLSTDILVNNASLSQLESRVRDMIATW